MTPTQNRQGALALVAAVLLAGGIPCRTACAEDGPSRTIGRVERLDPALDELVPPDAQMEVICDGFAWCEGPVWIREGGFLLFSDIPRNAIVRWDEKSGCSTYLQPAGYTGDSARGGESGSNGLTRLGTTRSRTT